MPAQSATLPPLHGIPRSPLRQSARRRQLQRFALLALCAIALWAAFSGANTLALTGASASVRWMSAQAGAQPVSLEQAKTAVEQLRHNLTDAEATQSAQNTQDAPNSVNTSGGSNSPGNSTPASIPAPTGALPANTPAVSPTAPALAFWRETQEEITSENRSATAPVLTVLGDAALCFPLRIASGGWPVAGDSIGCIVSEQLAWQLWGSTDVVGFSVTIDKQISTVRGVARGERAILLRGANESNSEEVFVGLNVSGLSVSDANAALQALLQGAGLPQPLQISWPAARAAFARFLCGVPLLAAASLLLLCAWRFVWRRFARWHGLLLFALALTAALALPALLAQVPAWLIPARWSDGAFWSNLWRTITDEILATLSLIVFSQDIPARLALLQTAMSSAVASACVFALHRFPIRGQSMVNKKSC